MILGGRSQTKRFMDGIGRLHYVLRCVLLIIACALSLLGFAFRVEAAPPATEYVEGEVIVTFKESTVIAHSPKALVAHGLHWAKHCGGLFQHRRRHTGLVKAAFRWTASLPYELRRDAAVESVEPNYLRWTS